MVSMYWSRDKIMDWTAEDIGSAIPEDPCVNEALEDDDEDTRAYRRDSNGCHTKAAVRGTVVKVDTQEGLFWTEGDNSGPGSSGHSTALELPSASSNAEGSKLADLGIHSGWNASEGNRKSVYDDEFVRAYLPTQAVVRSNEDGCASLKSESSWSEVSSSVSLELGSFGQRMKDSLWDRALLQEIFEIQKKINRCLAAAKKGELLMKGAKASFTGESSDYHVSKNWYKRIILMNSGKSYDDDMRQETLSLCCTRITAEKLMSSAEAMKQVIAFHGLSSLYNSEEQVSTELARFITHCETAIDGAIEEIQKQLVDAE